MYSSPLTCQIKTFLVKGMVEGKFTINQPLPSMRKLASQFGVSVFTVSRCIENLKQEELVRTVQGSGVYMQAIPSPEMLARELAAAHSVKISHWVFDRKSLRKMRIAHVRHQFQKEFGKQYPVQVIENQVEENAETAERLTLEAMEKGPDPTWAYTDQTYLPLLSETGLLTPMPSEDDIGSFLSRQLARELAERTQAHFSAIQPRLLQKCYPNQRGPSQTESNSASAIAAPPSNHPSALLIFPTGVTYSFLLYHKASFKKAGLDPDRAPQDWEELLAAAGKISAANGGAPAFHLPESTTLAGWLMQLVHQVQTHPGVCKTLSSGNRPGDSEALPQAQAIGWQSESSRRALEYLLELHHRNFLHVHAGDCELFEAGFLSGQLPMTIDYGHLAVSILHTGLGDQFGLAPLPRGPNNRTMSLANIGGCFLNPHSSLNQRIAAFAYLMNWESWIHHGGGGAAMQQAGVMEPFFSLMTNPDSDHFYVRNLPEDWRQGMEILLSQAVWEAPEASWKKRSLGRTLQKTFQQTSMLSTSTLQHYLWLSESNGD